MANIFKKIGKSLKKAAPLIGAGLGFDFVGPALGAGLGTALGSGIGTLVGGGDIEDALMAGAMGYGAGSLASGYLPTAAGAATKGVFAPAAAPTIGSQTAAANIASAATDPGMAQGLVGTEGAAGSSILGGIGNFMADNKLLTAGLGLGALGMLAGGQMEEEQQGFRYPDTGPGRAYETKVKGPITGTTYNLANEDEVEAYNDELLMLREKDFRYEMGGEVNGPGTGTSDSVPARLSDGEFVLTAKAVRGAGNGDRDIGAARMYDMMAELESMA